MVREAFPGRTDVVGLTACFITFPDLQHLSGADNPRERAGADRLADRALATR